MYGNKVTLGVFAISFSHLICLINVPEHQTTQPMLHRVLVIPIDLEHVSVLYGTPV